MAKAGRAFTLVGGFAQFLVLWRGVPDLTPHADEDGSNDGATTVSSAKVCCIVNTPYCIEKNSVLGEQLHGPLE